VTESTARKMMRDGDLNADGALDIYEASELAHVLGKITNDQRVEKRSVDLPVTDLPDWFKAMDTNMDGLIQGKELDRDY